MRVFQWTGLGCDVCGFGSVENLDEFDPFKPCPECQEVMVQPTVASTSAALVNAYVEKMTARGVTLLSDPAARYHLSILLHDLANSALKVKP